MGPETSDDDILESIVDEFTTKMRAGLRPSIQEYQQLHPKLASDIADVLSSISMIEQLKSASDSGTNSRRQLDDVSKLEQIGPYRIVREIGRGGMGVVFEAIHQSLGRQVAVKVMPTPLIDSDTHVQRFQREAQSAARLHHTNIVSVFGAGDGPGYHYYVMDYVDGQSLNSVIESLRSAPLTTSATEPSFISAKVDSATLPSSKLSVSNSSARLGWKPRSQSDYGKTGPDRYRWSANLAAQISDALSHAHLMGILHRDIKPSNMILDGSNRIWITDFGLAKDIAQDRALTKTGDVVGTPQYLPPESLELKYDVRSEVYGVGLVLYELIALQPAYTGSSPAELIRAISTRPPVAIQKLSPKIPIDLATIINKAIAREPENRYATAEDLHRDLVAFLEDRPIAARRTSALASAWRWSKRNPLAAGLSAASAVLLLLVAITTSIGYVLTTSALGRLRNQQTATAEALEQSTQNFQAMKSQYDRAESNVSLSLEAFDEVFKHLISRGSKGTIDQEIEGLREISGIEPSLTTADAAFLDRMVKFYEQFALLNAENDQLKLESARAYRRVGNIYHLVGQPKLAVEAYESSLRLLPSVERENIEELSKDELLNRVRIQNELSAAHRVARELVLAQNWSNRSIKLIELHPLSKSDPEVRFELARTKSALGFDVLRGLSSNPRPSSTGTNESGRPNSQDRSDRFSGNRPIIEGGRRLWERVNKPLIFDAIRILDELISEDAENAEFIALRASCYWCLAAVDLERDQANDFENRNRAIAALENLISKQPDNPEFQYLLALACSLALPNADKQEQSLVDRGAAIARQLSDQHPSVLDYHHLHAKLRIKLAGYGIEQDDRERAFENLQVARRSILILLGRAASDRSFEITISLLVRELVALERLYREDGNNRIANEINQMLRQINQARRP